MSLHSLRSRFRLLLLIFFLLVTISVGVTLGGLRTQEKDALIINLAGRQRMLTQQMIWLALNQPEDPALAQSMARFEQTLHALKEGGEILDAFGRPFSLPPAPDQEIHALLDQTSDSWRIFLENILDFQTLSVNDPKYHQRADGLQIESQNIIAKLDEVVSAFEKRAQIKVARLWAVQAVFLGGALALLLVGTLFTRHSVVAPLEKLGRVASRIGAGDFRTVVPKMNTSELRRLADVMELMRMELAVSHDQLQNHVEQRTSELVEAFEFSQEIVAQHELEDLLQSVTDRCRKLMHASESRLCLIREDGHALELVASQGGQPHVSNGHQPLNHGIALEVVGEGKTVTREGQNCVSCAYLGGHTPGTCAAAPLKTGTSILGALCVVRRSETPFNNDEIRALTLLANTAAIAIANARLVEQERQRAQQSAVLIERQRMAAELHDNLAQTLSLLRLKVGQVDHLTQPNADKIWAELHHIQNTIDTAYHQVRDAISGITLAPAITDSLREQIACCVRDFESASGIPVDFTDETNRELKLPAVTHSQVLHILRESLTNVRRHAQASQVMVRIDHRNGNASFEIRDNGCGFDPQQAPSNDHLGLKIMRTRAQRIGGSLEIQTAPGEGTQVILAVRPDEGVR